MSQATMQTKTIGDHDYTMGMLSPMASHKLLVKVVQMIGPSLGPVVDMFYGALSSGNSSILEKEVSPEFFTKAAGALFKDLNENVLDQVIKAFKEVTVVEGKGKLDTVFAAHFMGNLDEMYKWLAWGMNVQWGKVWSGLAAAAQEKIAAAAAQKEMTEAVASQSPST